MASQGMGVPSVSSPEERVIEFHSELMQLAAADYDRKLNEYYEKGFTQVVRAVLKSLAEQARQKIDARKFWQSEPKALSDKDLPSSDEIGEMIDRLNTVCQRYHLRLSAEAISELKVELLHHRNLQSIGEQTFFAFHSDLQELVLSFLLLKVIEERFEWLPYEATPDMPTGTFHVAFLELCRDREFSGALQFRKSLLDGLIPIVKKMGTNIETVLKELRALLALLEERLHAEMRKYNFEPIRNALTDQVRNALERAAQQKIVLPLIRELHEIFAANMEHVVRAMADPGRFSIIFDKEAHKIAFMPGDMRAMVVAFLRGEVDDRPTRRPQLQTEAVGEGDVADRELARVTEALMSVKLSRPRGTVLSLGNIEGVLASVHGVQHRADAIEQESAREPVVEAERGGGGGAEAGEGEGRAIVGPQANAADPARRPVPSFFAVQTGEVRSSQKPASQKSP